MQPDTAADLIDRSKNLNREARRAKAAIERRASRHGLLEGYATRAELAAEWNCHERTVARYENMPNGLPSVTIAGRKLYRIEDARRFMESRIRHPQPVRGSRGRAA